MYFTFGVLRDVCTSDKWQKSISKKVLKNGVNNDKV